MVKITINNTELEVNDNLTIYEAAKLINVKIPTLCYLNLHQGKILNNDANCRVCVVEVEGRHNLMPACATKVENGMVIKTNSIRTVKARRNVVELILSDHPQDCLTCSRNNQCELQDLASELSITEIKYAGKRAKRLKDTSSVSLVRNLEKCILCNRCKTVCSNIQTVGVYSKAGRGFETTMTTAFDTPMTESPCTFCGQCVSVCPTAALTQVNHTVEVWDAISNPDKTVIVQTAPAIRVALGELFGMPVGTNVTGKMVSALKEIGFDKVFDTNWAADLTVVEETKEFLNRLNNGGTLPMLTSCCPAWVNFIEYYYPELLDIPSSCKSPHQMFGALAKTYLAEKLQIKAENIIVVSVMPCLAKKYESTRLEMAHGGLQDVDYVITTKELARMIKEAGINFNHLKDTNFDQLMGESTGGGTIFGTTGGVIEAVVRNAVFELTDHELPRIKFTELRGMEGLREATVTINNQECKIAIANGLGNARALLDKIKKGEANYHLIEIMACPGGCIGGGGQPSYFKADQDFLAKRASALYQADAQKEVRISSKNPEIIKLYQDFLGEVGRKKAHELLHTHYQKREVEKPSE